MFHRERAYTARLLCGAAASSILIFSGAAYAQERVGIEIASQPLSKALGEFAAQTKQAVLVTPALTNQKISAPVTGAATPEAALTAMLAGTGLTYRRDGDTFLVVQGGSGPQSESAAGGGAEVEALIVTAQKRGENIQDVPIAVSAFSMEQLDNQKIEGGFDLLKAIPNVTFSKTNFTGYNFSIRGIGTQAVAAGADPGVAVSLNNTTLIVNRLFEQEYLDMDRIEVLRGPQGTLFGRNASAGVINIIPSKPTMGEHGGSIKLETGNYAAKRVRMHYNLPIGDTLAARVAYASTTRDGYVINEFDGEPIDGRDLYTARVSVGWEPTERFRANFFWERFEEDDNRLRSAKNLCHRDNGPDYIADLEVDTVELPQYVRRVVQQGCVAGSLYSDNAFGTPNGDAAPFITVARANNHFTYQLFSGAIGLDFFNSPATLTGIDVFADTRQSTDLRTVYSPIEPGYEAKSDIFDLTLQYDWGEALSLRSFTVFVDDSVFSTQDFTRYEASPGLFSDIGGSDVYPMFENFSPDGVFCDPQLGCADSFRAQDISQSESKQFNQQFELISDFEGPWNFSLGANYTKFDTTLDYFFFSNVLTALAQTPPFNGPLHNCALNNLGCVAVQTDDLYATAENPYGHNFFLSRNPYELNSAGVFGEGSLELSPSLKVTLGLRYTWDRKIFSPTPSQTLLADYRESLGLAGIPSVLDPEDGPESCIRLLLLCGAVGNAPGGRGYPKEPPIVQSWRTPTGRFVVDWAPDLSFTDKTMLYASYARGYKAGGANPPSIAPPAGIFIRDAQGAVAGRTFDAEYVNAFEMGAKNTLFEGAMTLNATVFYYDYQNYQIAKIVDRAASNENFDAEVFGAELELTARPTPNLLLNAAFGHLSTRIADGERSIDLMDRTQGGHQFYITQMPNPDYDPGAPQVAREDYVASECSASSGISCTTPVGQQFLAFDEWVVVKPNASQPSNCIVPAELLEVQMQRGIFSGTTLGVLNGASGFCAAGTLIGDQVGPLGYTALYGAPNSGAGFFDDVGGNELPNAPHWTASFGAQYTMALPGGWDATLRGDLYWQSQSFHRVYNTQFDKLRAWTNANLSLWVENPDWDVKAEVYVKNVFNETPITGAFLFADDTGLTTNIFTLDPRLVGVSVTKRF